MMKWRILLEALLIASMLLAGSSLLVPR